MKEHMRHARWPFSVEHFFVKIESRAEILSAININGWRLNIYGAGNTHNNLTANHVRGGLDENNSALATIRECFLVKSRHRSCIRSYINRDMSFAHETSLNRKIRHDNTNNIYCEGNPIPTPRGVDDDDDNKRIKRLRPFVSLARWLA